MSTHSSAVIRVGEVDQGKTAGFVWIGIRWYEQNAVFVTLGKNNPFP